jgi:hypothetical protein
MDGDVWDRAIHRPGARPATPALAQALGELARREDLHGKVGGIDGKQIEVAADIASTPLTEASAKR